ncbi:MAG: hypothetical protein CMP06_00225 [Xanthomonadales bacterium]|nr:hypothetical protein [Xanthomonadales bacterium]
MIAIIDQAMLSALNLLIGLAIIRLGEKLDYGIYVQLFTLLLLAQSLQDAAINAPMVALAPQHRARRMRAICAQLFRLQLGLSILVAFLAFTGILATSWRVGAEALPPSTAWPFALAVLGHTARGYARDYAFLLLLPKRVLALDTLYVGLVLLGLAAGVALERLDVEWVFGCIATAGLAAGGFGLQQTGLRPFGQHGRGRDVFRKAWALGRWAIPSVVLWWLSNYAVIYVVAVLMGVLATADVGASRLLLMPIGLCSVAWGNIFLPRASRWIAAHDFAQVEKVAAVASVLLALLIGIYMLVLLAVYDWLEAWVLGEEYAGLEGLTIAWAVYFGALSFRSAATHALSAGAQYRSLFGYTVLGLCITLPLVIAMTSGVGVTGAVWAQAAGEVTMGLILWLHGWSRFKRESAASTSGGARAIQPEVP